MHFVKQLYEDLIQSLYPNLCLSCGDELYNNNEQVCLKCIFELPRTSFENILLNPVEKIFQGRIFFNAAHSEFYFSKGQVIQRLIHQLKYKGNKDIGIWLGQMMGRSLAGSARFKDVDLLLPVPLNSKKEFKRGYNQSKIICEGLSDMMKTPVLDDCLIREKETQTQTRKHRTERWINVSGGFDLRNQAKLINKHILLVDDVLTTGATLEACTQVLSAVPGIRISIATLAFASI